MRLHMSDVCARALCVGEGTHIKSQFCGTMTNAHASHWHVQMSESVDAVAGRRWGARRPASAAAAATRTSIAWVSGDDCIAPPPPHPGSASNGSGSRRTDCTRCSIQKGAGVWRASQCNCINYCIWLTGPGTVFVYCCCLCDIMMMIVKVAGNIYHNTEGNPF